VHLTIKQNKMKKPKNNRGAYPVPDESLDRGDGLQGEMTRDEVIRHITPTDEDQPEGQKDSEDDATETSGATPGK
jgi:hypothetical protein